MKKLRSKRGESIIESLTAIIIVSLCVAFLMESIVLAAKINNHLNDKPLTFEYVSGTGSPTNITVRNVTDEGSFENFNFSTNTKEASISVQHHQTSNGYMYYD